MDAITAQQSVEKMMRRGRAFDSIEEWIDEQDLASDLKAALWMLAYSSQPKRRQRRFAREALAHIVVRA